MVEKYRLKKRPAPPRRTEVEFRRRHREFSSKKLDSIAVKRRESAHGSAGSITRALSDAEVAQ
jgi:hypothetical protein